MTDDPTTPTGEEPRSDETTDPEVSLPENRRSSRPAPAAPSSVPPPPPPPPGSSPGARSSPPPLPPRDSSGSPAGTPPARYGRTMPPTSPAQGPAAAQPPSIPAASKPPPLPGARPDTPSKSPGGTASATPPRSPSIPPRAGTAGGSESGQRIAQLQVHVRTARERIDELEGELDSLRSKLRHADERIAELEDAQQAGGDGNARELQRRVIRIEERLDRFRADNATLKDGFEELGRKSELRGREMSQLRSRIGDVEGLLDDVQRCELERQRRLDALEQAFADHNTSPTLPSSPTPEGEREDTQHALESPQQDDLRKIKGIGASTERKLHEAGVRTYAQMASWTEGDVADIAARIGAKPTRVAAWSEHAQELTGNG